MFKVLSSNLRCNYQRLSTNKTKFFHTTGSSSIKNYYEILSVPRNASQQEIKAAYYEKARVHHPDASKAKAGSLKFQEISEAYEVLSDKAKRRAYDTTTSPSPPPFGQHIYRDDLRKPRNTSSEPISMNHIQYVYKTLNKEEEETPRYRPFEDHTYPGTDFNRFEYSRRWDPELRTWVYSERRTAAQYNNKMRQNQKILQLCIGIVMLGIVTHVLNYKFFLRNMSNQSLKDSKDIAKDKAGMYVIQGKDE